MKKSSDSETIAALCTAPGGALNIIRISGPDALRAGNRVWQGRQPLGPDNARIMLLGKVCRIPEVKNSGEPCLAVFMPGPASYTGEDTVELHCHGGSFAPQRLLRAVFDSGVRPAEPGEFTKRAFLNGKMDLTQAEAVADLIAAKTDSAARLAEKQLSGQIGGKIRSIREELNHLLAEFESRLDFSEEDLDWMPPGQCAEKLETVIASMRKMILSAANGAILRDGVKAVIAGRPNAGKSSLLNALLGFDRAIVTEIPGTTRDTLEEFVSIRNIPVRLTDTAGLRESASDPVEKLGIRRSLDSLEDAAFIFWVLDASTAETAQESARYLLENRPKKGILLALWNKTDLDTVPEKLPEFPPEIPVLKISAATGSGLDGLTEKFAELVWKSAPDMTTTECEISARHADLLRQSLSSLEQAKEETLRESWELAAFCLREALNLTGSITGETVSPDILDEIFSRFCIGK